MEQLRRLLDEEMEEKALAMLGRSPNVIIPSLFYRFALSNAQSFGLSHEQRLKHIQRLFPSLQFIPGDAGR